MTKNKSQWLQYVLLASVLWGCTSNEFSARNNDYEGDDPGECEDDADNDRDGFFDCNDPGCANSPVCKESSHNDETNDTKSITHQSDKDSNEMSADKDNDEDKEDDESDVSEPKDTKTDPALDSEHEIDQSTASDTPQDSPRQRANDTDSEEANEADSGNESDTGGNGDTTRWWNTGGGGNAANDTESASIPGQDTNANDSSQTASDTSEDSGDTESEVVPTGECSDWEGIDTLSVLMVGNSQLIVHQPYDMLENISRSVSGCPVIISNDRFVAGGASLNWFLDDNQLLNAIASGRFDVVLIQESIDLVWYPTFEQEFRAAATQIVEAAHAIGAVPILYATPYTEEADHYGFCEMAEPQLRLAAELGIRVAAGGLAWLDVWEERPDIDPYEYPYGGEDRQHPGPLGIYISMAVVYAAITGISPVGSTNTPCGLDQCDPIDQDLATLIQNVAWAEYQETGQGSETFGCQ